MWNTIKKLEYRAAAGIADAADELSERLSNRIELPLSGIHGEQLFLTGFPRLQQQSQQIQSLYNKLPQHINTQDALWLDAWASATIEGAKATIEDAQHMAAPRTKGERMVINTLSGLQYAYSQPISKENIRHLWEIVTYDVCENASLRGSLYRSGMVYVGSAGRIAHVPATADLLSDLMDQLFCYLEHGTEDALIRSFVSHFYFVYLHPFCDGNGRTARILNASQLFHAGYTRIADTPLSHTLLSRLDRYYGSLSDSEMPLRGELAPWLDLSPFVSQMLSALESCVIDTAVAAEIL